MRRSALSGREGREDEVGYKSFDAKRARLGSSGGVLMSRRFSGEASSRRSIVHILSWYLVCIHILVARELVLGSHPRGRKTITVYTSRSMAHQWNLASIANIANKLSHDSHLYFSYNPIFPELNPTNHPLKPGPQALYPRFSTTPAARSVAPSPSPSHHLT